MTTNKNVGQVSTSSRSFVEVHHKLGHFPGTTRIEHILYEHFVPTKRVYPESVQVQATPRIYALEQCTFQGGSGERWVEVNPATNTVNNEPLLLWLGY